MASSSCSPAVCTTCVDPDMLCVPSSGHSLGRRRGGTRPRRPTQTHQDMTPGVPLPEVYHLSESFHDGRRLGDVQRGIMLRQDRGPMPQDSAGHVQAGLTLQFQGTQVPQLVRMPMRDL